MFECQQKIIAEQDWLRGMLLSDPRGSANAAVNLITPPVAPDADLGMLVIESDHYPPMSGSNLICTATVAIQTGMVPMIELLHRRGVDNTAGFVRVANRGAAGTRRRGACYQPPTLLLQPPAP